MGRSRGIILRAARIKQGKKRMHAQMREEKESDYAEEKGRVSRSRLDETGA